jgi:DNA-binding response OmpR family regulator
MKLKVLALGDEDLTRWVANSLMARGIEVVRFSAVPEIMTKLKQENFDLAVVDSRMEDLTNVCFRLIWLCRLRIAVVTKDIQTDWSELRSLGVDAFISENSGPAELDADIEAIARKGCHQFSHIQVLVIEDDKYIREAIRLCFRIFWPEAEVSFADEGQAGITLAKNKPPDVILLDLGLPDINGFEVLNRIRTFSQVPVIILTATRDQENVVRAIQSGANDYVVKPFKQIELMPRVRKVCHSGPA